MPNSPSHRWPSRLANNTIYFAMRGVGRLPFGMFGAWYLGLLFGWVLVFYTFLAFGFGSAVAFERVRARDRKALYTYFGVLDG
jgi:hypothetical protein